MSNGPVANWGNYADTGDISTLVSWVETNMPRSTTPVWNLLQCQLTRKPRPTGTSGRTEKR